MSARTPTSPDARARSRMVIYATGPGDVARTFRHWVKNQRDPLEVSETYSGQYFDLVRALGVRTLVISSHPRPDDVREGDIRVIHRPIPLRSRGGALWHLGALLDELRTIFATLWNGADVLILTTPAHWWVFGALRPTGTRLIACIHGAFASGADAGASASALSRALRAGDAWFWRRCVDATLCISDQLAQQVRVLAGAPRGPVIACVPKFDPSDFDPSPPAPQDGAFRVLYLGRITRGKGLDVMLDAARWLKDRGASRAVWELCGDGPYLADVRAAIERDGLSGAVVTHGHVDRATIRDALARCSVVVAPTLAEINEGLNKSVVEGALAGRPVVTSDAVPAGPMVGGAAIIVPSGDAAALAEAIARLESDGALYADMRRAALDFRERFFKDDRTWGQQLRRVLQDLIGVPAATTPHPSAAGT